jgi:iron complex outermembrane receptor protein
MQGWAIVPGQITKARTASAGFYNVNLDHDTTYSVEQKNISATYKSDLEVGKLVNIFSYDTTNLTQQFDQDASPANVVYAYIKRGSNTWTEEFQLISPDASTVKWIGGFFYLHNRQTAKPLQITGAAIAPLTYSSIYANMPEDSYAGYGQATISAFDKTNLTMGLRYTIDNRSLSASSATSANPSGISYLAQHTDTKMTWRAALDREIAPDVLGYASISRGFKSGLFNITAPANPAVLPQTVDAYEIGLKTEAFDHSLRISAAGFYNIFDNIQVRQNVPGGFLLLNAPKARTQGFDIDMSTTPIQDLTVQGAVAYLDGKYGRFPNAPFLHPSPLAARYPPRAMLPAGTLF